MQFFSPGYSRSRGSRQLFARTSFRVLTLLVVLCSLAAAAWLLLSQPPAVSAVTTVPTKMNFQGRLTDASGNIKPNGIYNMRFKLFTVATAGTNVWSEDRLVSATQGVQVTNGLFSVQLGSVTALPASLFASGALYLEVELPTPASATTSSPVWSEGPMTPRNQMATSAYAYNSETLDGQDGDYYTNAANLTGTVSAARLSGSYTGITGTGALAAGSITTGFGAIVTGNTISGTQLTSTVATGTAPLVVSSTTKVTNLNVDLLDGLDSTSFAAASGSGSYIQNTTNPQTASMNITGSATVGSMTVNGNLVVTSSVTTGINGSGGYVSLHTGRAWDSAYEYLGFNSGSTRQGIILYDGAWAGCRNVSYELCLKAENDNDLTLVSEWDVYLWAKGGAGDIHLNAGSGQILAVNNGTSTSPAYSFTSNTGMGMYVTSASELALGTSSTARLVLSGSSAEIWMGTTQRAERMCHNRGNAPTAGLAIIGDCSAGGSDFAEYYGSPGDVPVATIVEYDEAKPIEYLVDPTDTSRMGNKAFVKTATNRSKSLGVYSTNPFVDILGKEYYSPSDNIIPIGLAGRVPVRVNASNGSIAVGDPIALSNTPGVGAKAVTSGQIIGYSMQAYSGEGEGTVVALISTGYWAPSDMDTLQGQSAEVNSLTVSGMASIADLNVSGTATLRTLAVTGNATIEGTLTVAGNVKTGNLTVNGRLVSGGKTPTAAGSAATTVVLDGTDTAGSLTIVAKNLESLTAPVAKVTFSEAYPSAFKTVLSATNESATDLRVYIKKTTEGFEVFSRDALRPGVEYDFDYIVVGTE